MTKFILQKIVTIMRKLLVVFFAFLMFCLSSCSEDVSLNVNETPVDAVATDGDDSDTAPGQKPPGGGN